MTQEILDGVGAFRITKIVGKHDLPRYRDKNTVDSPVVAIRGL